MKSKVFITQTGSLTFSLFHDMESQKKVYYLVNVYYTEEKHRGEDYHFSLSPLRDSIILTAAYNNRTATFFFFATANY